MAPGGPTVRCGLDLRLPVGQQCAAFEQVGRSVAHRAQLNTAWLMRSLRACRAQGKASHALWQAWALMEQRQGDKAMVRPLYNRGLEVRCGENSLMCGGWMAPLAEAGWHAAF